MAYYVQILTKSFGPFDAEQLKEMKDNGKLGKSTAVSENKIDWVTADSFDFLFPPPQQATQQFQPTPHITQNPNSTFAKISNTSSAKESANWFYSYDGVDGFGPVTASAIIQMIKSGTLKAESVAWLEGQFAQKLNELPQFSAILNSLSTQQHNTKSPSEIDLFCSSCGSPLASSGICPACGKSRSQNSRSGSPAVKTDTTGIGYADVLKKYADFGGRARRREFWNFTIYNMIILPLLLTSIGIIAIFIMTALNANHEAKIAVIGVLLVLYVIYNLLIFLPSLAVCIRRLHDTGNSGWMVLMMLIPVVGAIILLVFLTQDSQPMNNQYGQNPKYTY
ncbi:MAG: DUF805 domain-containing protein [Planctomycetaceae bacterium]|jgi:uncharacterized membrane protein YhaH (DUF805 family)|nr:DUF805 domain-containing protein [Planctomycetaceae bacterium]